MATIYVDSTGSNGGGSEASPFNNLLSAVTLLNANTTAVNRVFLSGVFRESAGLSLVGNFTDLEIVRWAGRSADPPQIRGDVPLSGWEVAGGPAPAGTYEVTTTGISIIGAVWNWDDNVDGTGHRHFGHLEAGTFDALAAGEWAQSGGVLQVFLPSTAPGGAGVDPDTLTEVSALRGSVSGIDIFTAGRVIIEGIDTMLWTGDGMYGIRVRGGGSGGVAIVRNCKGYDCGFHNIGIASNITSGSRIDACLTSGCRQGTGTNFVIYCDNTGTVTDLKSSDCIAYMGGLFTDDLDTPMTTGISTSGGATAWIGHTDPENPTADQYLEDYEVHRLRCYGNQYAFGFMFSFPGASTVPSDLADGHTYPQRLYDCVGTDLARGISIASNTSYVAAFRCKFEGDMDFVGSGNATAFNPVGDATGMYFECCEIIFDSGSAGTHQTLWPNGAQGLYLINCSISARCSGQANAVMRISNITTPEVIAVHGCVIHIPASSTDDRYTTGTITTAELEHTDNWYNGVRTGTDGYSNQAAIDTQADWEANVDLNGIYDDDPEFVDELADLKPAAGSPLLTTKKVLTWGTPRLGINGREYDGSYGAHQGGAMTGVGARIPMMGAG